MSFELFSKIYFTLIYSILSWMGIGGAILMIFYSHTFQALFLGYSILIIIFSIYMLIWFKKRKTIMGVLCLHLGIIFILFGVYGKQEIYQSDKNYSSVSLGKQYSYNLLNIFSEKELLDMGFAASIVLQISEEQKNQFQDIFYEIENSQNISLPSAIPNALVNKKEARYILYNPKNADTDNLIFLLHGNAGGFLFYPKIFQSIADKYNAKMVMPQFGWGNWNELGGKELIYDTYNDLLQKNIISTKTKITVIAVSNGGVGVAEILKSDTKNIFSEIICISCVFDTKQYEKNLSSISEKRFLILHGDQDERTPLQNYLHIQNSLPKHSNKIYQDQNHFLLLQKKDDILKEIKKFMQ